MKLPLRYHTDTGYILGSDGRLVADLRRANYPGSIEAQHAREIVAACNAFEALVAACNSLVCSCTEEGILDPFSASLALKAAHSALAAIPK